MTMCSVTSLGSYESYIVQDTYSFNDPPKLLDDLMVETVKFSLH